MIVLQDDRLRVRLDPSHGAEILDLVDLAAGRQLLGRPPFGSELPRAGDLDEEAWTASYRGSWQLVAPAGSGTKRAATEGPGASTRRCSSSSPPPSPHSMGLAAAIEQGHARWLEPGESVSYTITARVVS